jgi:Uma2 family endonuclease
LCLWRRLPALGYSTSCGQENGRFITRPVVVFEVLSEETELLDRSDKRREYQALPPLVHYVLMSQDTPHVEVYSRRAGQ